MGIYDRMGKRLIDALNGEMDTEYSVELRPDRSDPTEVYLLTGNQQDLKSQISLILALRTIMEGNDAFLGYPYQEYLWKHPSPLMVQIHWRLKKEPPWEPAELIQRLNLNRASPPRPYVTIPIERSQLTWDNIKRAAGGADGFSWGNYYAVARIGNQSAQKVGKGGVIKVYGGTQQAALERINALLPLTGETLWTVTTGREEQNLGVRQTDPGFKKPTVRMWPAWFTIINWQLVDAARRSSDVGRSTSLGKKIRKQGKIPLYIERTSDEINELINEFASRATSS